MTPLTLIHLLHIANPGEARRALMDIPQPGLAPRSLVHLGNGFTWHAEPECPPEIGAFIRPVPRYRDDEWAAEYTAYNVAKNARFDHLRDWPALPPKTVRRAIRRAWLAESPDGLLVVTPEGRVAWFLARHGYAEDEPPMPRARRSRKRRPQGAAMMFSRYRWHVQGRNRCGSTPKPAPHLRRTGS